MMKQNNIVFLHNLLLGYCRSQTSLMNKLLFPWDVKEGSVLELINIISKAFSHMEMLLMIWHFKNLQ